MKIDKETLRMIRIVEGLKRRKIFVSMVMTRTGTQLSWWDAGQHEVRTGDMDSARHYLNVLDENDRRELEWVGRRLGRVM